MLDKKRFTLLDVNVADQPRFLEQKASGGNVWKKITSPNRHKQKLSGKNIVALAKVCLGIEKHYGFPCDIEWALAGGKFYITQSRPITTL